jgi:hypothetical protein
MVDLGFDTGQGQEIFPSPWDSFIFTFTVTVTYILKVKDSKSFWQLIIGQFLFSLLLY